MARNEVWGVDVGKSGIKAVKMRKVRDQLEVVAIDIVEYEQDFSESENVDREEQIRQALSELQARNKIKKNDSIYVSIPGQATFNRLITIPPVEPKRIREIVSYEAQQQIPFPIDEVIWDYQLIGPQDKSVEEREVMLFAVRREIINNFLANLKAADIKIKGVQIAPLAIYNFVRYERPEMEAGVAIDIGAENTDLVVVDHDKLWLRALPSAGDDITKALQDRFNIPYQEAEKLKLRSGKTKQAKKIFEVMKPVLKDLVGEIHRSVGYYKSMSKEIKFEKMIFLGNATKLSGFEKFFAQNLQYDITVLSDVKRIRVSQKINVNQFKTNISTFAVAMGLAIQGLGKAANNIMLLPEDVIDDEVREKQRPIYVAAILFLAFVPFWWWYTGQGLQQRGQFLERRVNNIKSKQDDLLKKIAPVRDYGGLKGELAVLGKVGMTRDKWSVLLNEINAVFLEANKGSTQEDRIWFLGLEVVEERRQSPTFEEPPAPGQTRPTKYRDVSLYLKASLNVSFKAVQSKDKGKASASYDYLNAKLVEPLNPLLFHLEDFPDLPKLLAKIRDATPWDPFSVYIRDSLLSKDIRRQLEKGKEPSPFVQKSFVTTLNKMIQGELLYDQKRFQSAKLRKITSDWLQEHEELAKKGKEGGDETERERLVKRLQRLNRLLLEDAYPELVPRPPFEDVSIEKIRPKSKIFPGEDDELGDKKDFNYFHATVAVRIKVDETRETAQ